MESKNGQLNPVINEALEYLDVVVAKAPLTRNEHFTAMQLLKKIENGFVALEAEKTALKKALEIATKTKQASEELGVPLAETGERL